MLTDLQIEQLFRFCSRHYVQHYDVQCELVDHMANAIEEKMALVPDLSFDQALEEVYITFGPRGFSPIVREKTKALKRRNRREIQHSMLQFFRWPSILLTASMIALQWTAWRFAGTGALFISIALLSLLGAGFLLADFSRKRMPQTKPLLANDFMESPLSFNFMVYVQLGFLLIQVVNFYNMASHEHLATPFLLAFLADAQAFVFTCTLAAMKKNRFRLQELYPAAFNQKYP